MIQKLGLAFKSCAECFHESK